MVFDIGKFFQGRISLKCKLLIQERKEVVLAAAPFTINADPLDVVNFTYPFDIQPYTIMYRRPRELSRAMLFINPFTPLVNLLKTMFFDISECM
jgi:hypothetical protein